MSKLKNVKNKIELNWASLNIAELVLLTSLICMHNVCDIFYQYVIIVILLFIILIYTVCIFIPCYFT